MYRQKGFTLIELVVVLVILGLLAATALPRFINVTSEARGASLSGLAGSLTSAAALARAQYIVTASNAATTVDMEGVDVTVFAETAQPGLGGIPTADAAGIIAAAQIDTTAFAPQGAGGTAVGSTITFWPTSGGGAGCQVTYQPNGSPSRVTVVKSTC